MDRVIYEQCEDVMRREDESVLRDVERPESYFSRSTSERHEKFR